MKREDIIALGYTKEYIAHIETQVPGLIEEAVKRIKFMPFDVDSAFVAIKPEGKASIVLRHLCKQSGLAILEATAPKGQQLAIIHSLHTEINGMRRDKDHTKLINIRGHLRTIDRMPMYLEEGAHGRQYVYPLFDWSELQTMVASMMIEEQMRAELKAEYEVRKQKSIDDLVADTVAEEDKLWLEQVRKIIGE